MRNAVLITVLIAGMTAFADVDLVREGKPVADIVVPTNTHISVQAAAQELQRHLEKMSGARLPIVDAPSADVPNHVYLGASAYTRQLGATLDDIRHDGYKIIVDEHHVVIAGRDIDNYTKMVGKITADKKKRQAEWEAFTGHNWRRPCFHAYGDFNQECGFDLQDGTGTLYGIYDLLEQLGWRWYMPVPDIGIVYPELKDVVIKTQSIKREPEFPIRIYTDSNRGTFREEFLWQKSMMLGTSYVLPIFHAIGRLTAWDEANQPDAYYGKVGGKKVWYSPRLSNVRLRNDFMEFLDCFRRAFPGIDYACIGQPDGFTVLDEEDAAAGWDKLDTRGPGGRFSDYYWDFIMDIRQRYMKEHPDAKFSVFAYSSTTRPPTSIDKVPDNVVVCYSQASQRWVAPEAADQLAYRNEWTNRFTRSDQLFIWEHYLYYRAKSDYPPIPVIFTPDMKRNFAGLYDHSVGGLVEVAWTSTEEREKSHLVTANIGLSHLMLLLHAKLWWDRNLDIPAFIDDYCARFFGPASEEMKEFYRFGEEVWMRPGPRLVVDEEHGFLTKKDADRYFEILTQARRKAGDTVYGKRVDFIAAEMEPLKKAFDKLTRTGPDVRCFEAVAPSKIDGDLDKPFWREPAHSYVTLKHMLDSEKPVRVKTRTTFRWVPQEHALVIGVECLEPNMDKLVASCKDRDSLALFVDDFVEFQLTTNNGTSPKVAVNPNGVVYDRCDAMGAEDPPLSYTVNDVAVKKYPDRWTVEVKFDARALCGDRPTKSYPWGVNVCRQRMAGDETECYMLSPSGTSFKDRTCMANLQMRK